MLTAIVRFFGWDKAPPVRPPTKAKARPVQAAAGGVRPRPGPVGAAPTPASAHDKSKAQASGKDVKPAMAVIPGRDEVQRMPQVASPGLPPVDPVGQATARTGSDVMAQSAKGLAPAGRSPMASARDSFDGATGSSPGFDRFAADPASPGLGRDQTLPRADYLDLGLESLEMVDSSIERSFADAGSAQGSSKDHGNEPKDCSDEVWDPVHELDQLELFPGLPALSEHSTVTERPGEDTFHFKDRKDCDGSFETFAPGGEAVKIGGLSLDVDPPIESGLPRVTTPARLFPKRPQRVADRPRSEEWNDDELLTLPEAAALFWPNGPITTNTLRTAGRDGTLAITKVAGKFFTTPMAIRRMGQGEAVEMPGGETAAPTANSARAMFEARLEDARRQARERKRRQRATKRSVVPSDPGAGR